MGFLPRDPLFRDDTKGGRPPPFGNPRISSSLSVRRWKRLAGIARRESGVQAFSPTAKTLAQGRIHSARANEILRGPRAVHRTVRGRIQRGGRSPLIGRRGGGVHRGGTPSKGSLPYACFCLLFHEGKVGRGAGRSPRGISISHRHRHPLHAIHGPLDEPLDVQGGLILGHLLQHRVGPGVAGGETVQQSS